MLGSDPCSHFLLPGPQGIKEPEQLYSIQRPELSSRVFPPLQSKAVMCGKCAQEMVCFKCEGDRPECPKCSREMACLHCDRPVAKNNRSEGCAAKSGWAPPEQWAGARAWSARRGGGGGGGNYWAPLTRKRHTMPHSAQSQHTNHWAPRTRKRHQQEHRPQRPTESSDPTQHAKGRTGDRPGPRKGTTTRRNVTQGGDPITIAWPGITAWHPRAASGMTNCSASDTAPGVAYGTVQM